MNKYKSIFLSLLVILITIFAINQKSIQASSVEISELKPFQCTSIFYQVSTNGPNNNSSADFSVYDTSIEPWRLLTRQGGLPVMNAMGFRVKDNFVYALGTFNSIINGNFKNHLFQIDTGGNYHDLGKVPGIPDDYTNLAGDFITNPNDVKKDGKLYVMSGNPNDRVMYQVDVVPNANGSLKVARTVELDDSLNRAFDMAYSSIKNKFYGYEAGSGGPNTGRIFSLEIVEENGQLKGKVRRFGPNYDYSLTGATWVSGNDLLAYQSTSGDIVKFDISKQASIPEPTIYKSNKVVFSNDGVSCPNASSPFLSYPWLQTQRGDVTSLENIVGQDINVGGPLTETIGAKHTTAGIKYVPAEAEFVVVSINNGNNFCSSKLYVLAKNETLRNNCDTGGYLSTGVDFDKINIAVQNAWSNNGSGITDNPSINPTACKPYNTKYGGAGEVTLTDYDASLGCAGGGLTKLGVNNQDQPTVLRVDGNITGKGTLWVDGDLIIKSDIKYATNGVGSNLANLPNLAIYATGKITIAENVIQIDAMLVSKSQIITCEGSESLDAGKCASKLTVNGLFASYNKIDFGRRYNVQNDPNNNPAEKLIMTAQSAMLPPPGFSKSDGDTNSQLQFNSSELPPRLN